MARDALDAQEEKKQDDGDEAVESSVAATAQEAADVHLEFSTRRTAGWQRDQIQSVFVRGTQSTGPVAEKSRAVAELRAQSVPSVIAGHIIALYLATTAVIAHSPNCCSSPGHTTIHTDVLHHAGGRGV